MEARPVPMVDDDSDSRGLTADVLSSTQFGPPSNGKRARCCPGLRRFPRSVRTKPRLEAQSEKIYRHADFAFGLVAAVNGSLVAQKTSTPVTLKDAHGQSVGTTTPIKWRNVIFRRSNLLARTSILMASSTDCRTHKDPTPAT